MGVLAVSQVVAGYSAADMILKGVSLTLGPGEIVCIIGPNGAGKSTLLKAIAGLVRVSQGSIRIDDTRLDGLAPKQVARAGVAFVPQEHNVFPSMSVRENLEMGGYVETAAAPQRIDKLFGRFPVLAEKRRQAARTLSGGQRQILAMAMALMVAPSVLLLDEPSAGLSPKAAETLFATIGEIAREGTSIALVEQNAEAALGIAQRAYVFVDGRNAHEGEAAALAADPEVRRIFLGG